MTEKQVKEIISKRTPIQNILRMSNYSNYWEVVGEVGGDILTYRVYRNGDITER